MQRSARLDDGGGTLGPPSSFCPFLSTQESPLTVPKLCDMSLELMLECAFSAQLPE